MKPETCPQFTAAWLHSSANFLITSNHFTIAFALFLPNGNQCHAVSGEGLSTSGILKTGFPLNSLTSGCGPCCSFMGVLSLVDGLKVEACDGGSHADT